MKLRSPAVAGLFYPGGTVDLRATLENLLEGCDPPSRQCPKALIVPHAGYIYSGRTAARAYACLHGADPPIRRVLLLGPSHRVALRGMALPDCDAFATPLGPVPIDAEACARLAGLPGIQIDDAAHVGEHSLEVQLPFLQTVLGSFSIVPLVVGEAPPAVVAAAIALLWDDPGMVVVVSTDLSHYHHFEEAHALDFNTVRRILALEEHIDPMQACGASPLNGFLGFARQRGLRPRLIDLCNSGDTAGDRSRVVGYCAVAFDEELVHHAA